MGRGVESGANACGAESGVDHGAGGTFPVGAGDVDHAIGTLGIAEVGEYGLNALQAELSGEDFVAQGKEKMFRFGVSHFRWIQFRGRLVQAGQTAERGGELHGSENSLGDRFRGGDTDRVDGSAGAAKREGDHQIAVGHRIYGVDGARHA